MRVYVWNLDLVRSKLRREAATECEWWQAEAATGKWGGRLIVLARWASLAAEGDPEIRMDYVPVDCEPRGFSGWPGSKRTFKALPRPVVPPPRPPAQPPAQPRAKAPAAKRAARPFPSLTFRRDAETNHQRVAPVAAIYADLGMSTTNIGRDMGQWQRNFPTYADAIFTAPRRGQGRKRGGKAEWYATEPALYHMHTKRLRLR